MSADKVPEGVQPAHRVAAGVIGAAARSLSDIRQERDDLKDKLEKAGGPRLLGADLLDPSPLSDRMIDVSDVDFATLRTSIEQEGQKVAVQVRGHPSAPGRYQIIYGHRRWRAAMDLGLPVKAEVVEATDEELAIAQGIENAARQNLTWIERAMFAWRLDKFGIKAKGIRAALAVDDAEIARFRSVCRVVPLDVIKAIGRAPSIGRPRWVELASAVGNRPETALVLIRDILSADKVLTAPSDERFRFALACLQDAKLCVAQVLDLKNPNGRTIGRLSSKRGDVRISMEKAHAEAFSSFLQAEMPDLLSKFFASQGADKA